MERVAVDPKAKAYWEKYFKPVGDFGKQWTDNIPRRVKAECARLAGVNEADVLPIPQGHTHKGGAVFEVEGSVRVLTKTGAVDRLWTATLNLADSSVSKMELYAPR